MSLSLHLLWLTCVSDVRVYVLYVLASSEAEAYVATALKTMGPLPRQRFKLSCLTQALHFLNGTSYLNVCVIYCTWMSM